jgi:hypothetical protein
MLTAVAKSQGMSQIELTYLEILLIHTHTHTKVIVRPGSGS